MASSTSSNNYQNWTRFIMHLLAAVQNITLNEWPTSYEINDGETFDFIVVGSGSAGAIVASRLSEVCQWKVLMIEAGGDPSFASVVPGVFYLQPHTEYDWNYQGSYHRGSGLAHRNGTSFVPRGKCLGGSSSINWMIYSRGVPSEYDEWERFAAGWNWKTALKYFKKLEGMTDPEVLLKNPELHSAKGPVLVSRPKLNDYFQEKIDMLLDALEEIGLKRILELNGFDIQGATRPHSTFAYGRRSSTAEAYLKPAKDRSNLHVAKFTRATKILIDSESRHAYGVKVLLKSGKIAKVYAKKEVIVSAGAIESPKLLMLSGIGPENELKKFGIDVIADLPVGKNLQDHIVASVLLKGGNSTAEEQTKYALKELHAYPFPFTTGYYNGDSPLIPQIQLFGHHFGANSSLLRAMCQSITNIDETLCNSMVDANKYNEVEVIYVTLLHPKSTGAIRLKSTDALDDPLIKLNIFNEDEDIKLLAKAVKFITRLENTKYFKEVNGGVAKLKVTGCEGLKQGTDRFWKCFVRNSASSLQHAVGTCAMGAVVDEFLKVYGFSGLRVIDASVMPMIPSGNTNAPTMMIGEHAADLIKKDYL